METLIRSLKYDLRPHWEWPARVLVQDETVIVCLSKLGTVATHHTHQTQFPFQYHCLAIFPAGAWYNALLLFDHTEKLVQVYCNVALPPERHPDRIDWVDLDLDVVFPAGGSASLVDEDEFEEHLVKYGYPPDVIQGAREAAQFLLDRAEAGQEPFLPWNLREALERFGCKIEESELS